MKKVRNKLWDWTKDRLKKRRGEDRIIVIGTPGKVEKLPGTCDFESDLLAALKIIEQQRKKQNENCHEPTNS